MLAVANHCHPYWFPLASGFWHSSGFLPPPHMNLFFHPFASAPIHWAWAPFKVYLAPDYSSLPHPSSSFLNPNQERHLHTCVASTAKFYLQSLLSKPLALPSPLPLVPLSPCPVSDPTCVSHTTITTTCVLCSHTFINWKRLKLKITQLNSSLAFFFPPPSSSMLRFLHFKTG